MRLKSHVSWGEAVRRVAFSSYFRAQTGKVTEASLSERINLLGHVSRQDEKNRLEEMGVVVCSSVFFISQ